MVIALLVCIIMVLTAMLARAIGLPKLNVVSAFTASWVPMLTVAGVFDGVSRGLSELTWLMILTAWGCLVAGAFSGWVLTATRKTLPTSISIDIDIVRVRKMHFILTVAFMVYVAFQLTNALPLIASSGGWGTAFSSGGNALRNAMLQEALQNSQSTLESNSLILSVINYGTFVAGTVATYTGAVLWRAGQRFVGILPVVVAAVLSLVTLQRTSVVLVCLLFFFGLAALRLSGTHIPHCRAVSSRRWAPLSSARRPGPGRRRALMATILAAAAVVGFLFTTTDIRGRPGDSTIDVQIGEYLIGGLAGLNAQNTQGSDWEALPGEQPGTSDPAPGLGGYTFSGLSAVLYRLGVPIELTRVNLNFTRVELYGRPTLTNVVTALGEFYLDFRWAGLVIVPFLLGWATSRLQRRLAGSEQIGTVPVVAYLLTISFWSYFVAWFSDLRQLLVAVLGGAVLTWAVRRRAKTSATSAVQLVTRSSGAPKPFN